ncbi:MAG TPA: hypothetical protein PL033_13195 [Candidatus Brocadiia bacterium]|nr:hypothetical protein [Candidatus Brocadiia bacterium]
MNAQELSNLRQIEDLNQRGGRTLSITDMIRAGTLSAQMAAYMFRAVARGASVLTAAVPGGAGKSTLLANLLNFLPPGTRIITTPDGAAIRANLKKPPGGSPCFLVHEIGGGPYYAYIWERDVADFFRLAGSGRRIAACVHAETLKGLRGILLSPHLGVQENDFRNLDLIAFMSVCGEGARVIRRVSSVCDSRARETPAGGRPQAHETVFQWDRAQDAFSGLHDSERKSLSPYLDFIAELVSSDISLFEDVRERALAFYARFEPPQ